MRGSDRRRPCEVTCISVLFVSEVCAREAARGRGPCQGNDAQAPRLRPRAPATRASGARGTPPCWVEPGLPAGLGLQLRTETPGPCDPLAFLTKNCAASKKSPDSSTCSDAIWGEIDSFCKAKEPVQLRRGRQVTIHSPPTSSISLRSASGGTTWTLSPNRVSICPRQRALRGCLREALGMRRCLPSRVSVRDGTRRPQVPTSQGTGEPCCTVFRAATRGSPATSRTGR